MMSDAAILLALAGWLALWCARETGRAGIRRGSGLAALAAPTPRAAAQHPSATAPEDDDNWPAAAAALPSPLPAPDSGAPSTMAGGGQGTPHP